MIRFSGLNALGKLQGCYLYNIHHNVLRHLLGVFPDVFNSSLRQKHLWNTPSKSVRTEFMFICRKSNLFFISFIIFLFIIISSLKVLYTLPYFLIISSLSFLPYTNIETS